MSEPVKPLPCPVCGKKPSTDRRTDGSCDTGCWSSKPFEHRIDGGAQLFGSKQAAIEHWNAIVNATRAATIKKPTKGTEE